MSIIRNPESLDAAIRCASIVADAMTAAAPYPQNGIIYMEYEKTILALCAVAERLAKDALEPEAPKEVEPPLVEDPEEVEQPVEQEPAPTEQEETPESEQASDPIE